MCVCACVCMRGRGVRMPQWCPEGTWVPPSQIGAPKPAQVPITHMTLNLSCHSETEWERAATFSRGDGGAGLVQCCGWGRRASCVCVECVYDWHLTARLASRVTACHPTLFYKSRLIGRTKPYKSNPTPSVTKTASLWDATLRLNPITSLK